MSEKSPMPPQCQGGSGCTCCGPDCDCGCIEKCPAYKRLSAVYVPPRNQGKAMMSEIQAGDGWRLLGPDEVVKDGDERWRRSEKRWVLIPMDVPYTAKAYPAVRRRIPAKPDAMEIDEFGLTQATICTSGGVSLRQQDISGFGEYVFLESSEQIRKLGEWLISVAEWREA